jgi:hypothetical protein
VRLVESTVRSIFRRGDDVDQSLAVSVSNHLDGKDQRIGNRSETSVHEWNSGCRTGETREAHREDDGEFESSISCMGFRLKTDRIAHALVSCPSRTRSQILRRALIECVLLPVQCSFLFLRLNEFN